MAVVIAALIPLVNVLCVLILSRYAQDEQFNLRSTALTLIKNPFIWSCCVGILINPVSAFVPTPINNVFEIIGRAALAGGLLVVGAGLDLPRLNKPNLAHLLPIVLKLLLMPAMVYAAGWAVGLTGTPLSVALIAATVPTAAASYILARKMGGDAPLMAEITTVQTMFAMLTMPIILQNVLI